MNIAIQKNTLAFLGMFTLLISSVIVTLSFKNHLSDSISITISVLSGIALFFIAVVMLFEAVVDICNPSK